MTMLLEFLERHRARHLFRSSHLKLRSGLSMATGSAYIFPVSEKHTETENENGSFSMSCESERRKTEMEIGIPFYKVVGNQK